MHIVAIRVSLAPLQLPLADPVQLGGGLRCLCALLYNDLQRGRFGSIIVSNLQLLDKKKNKIWGGSVEELQIAHRRGYIDGTHFKDTLLLRGFVEPATCRRSPAVARCTASMRCAAVRYILQMNRYSPRMI